MKFNREQQIYLVQYNANSDLDVEKMGVLLSVKNKRSIAVWQKCSLQKYSYAAGKYSGTLKLGPVKNAEDAVLAEVCQK